MASLKLTFADVYKEVSRYIGWGISPSGQDATDAKAVTHAGYRNFMYPINMLTGKAHTWSFLIKHATLTIANDKWRYPLPDNFDRLCVGFSYSESDGYMRMKKVSPFAIRDHQASIDSSGAPSEFAIVPGTYTPEHGQGQEVWFYEKPNQAYVLHYAYIIRPEQLVNDNDYFIGGDFASEAILESALAVAELRWDGGRKDVHRNRAEQLIQQLIAADNMAARPDYYGVLYDPGLSSLGYKRPLETIDAVYDE